MEKKKSKIQMKALNPMVLLAIIIIGCAIATYVVPAGQYDRILDPATEREIVDRHLSLCRTESGRNICAF